ncbi:Cytochrome B561 [Pseudomonas sp. LAMO17WK12:I6]|uniref:cytochrome b n=1 Tax=Pseudomonas sp. LAMO17WK12:I6 TaxID=1286372 RepID=UPI000BD78824|nr:cytochrome b/b6 domain-containing protein [Pseudomonas sp. LAMO17WK12:I6]SNY46246.1 Cytochrome B561 [Pseudomonas sp. LAMO17WK12:I6]
MTRDTAVTRYGKLSITLHWLMLALFVGVYACVEIKGFMPKGSEARGLLMGFHGLFGTSIFVLVWVRLLGRLTPRPPITPKPPAWQTGISHLMHLALYVLMIATPILAWLMLAAADKPGAVGAARSRCCALVEQSGAVAVAEPDSGGVAGGVIRCCVAAQLRRWFE